MNNNYFETKRKEDCNGCKICALRCPVNCIKMVEDEEGFLYPEIDEEKCIHCNKCRNICSNSNIIKREEIDAYAVINKDDEIRKKSSSGGVFSLLANYVLKNNGIVFGVCYNEKMEVTHESAQTKEECIKFRGSKYVRSNTKDTFKEIEKILLNNKLVLFTGTPCQVNALIKFLQKPYEKLITCNIICHANPSPKVFRNYIKELEKIKNKKIINIEFRSKENGWRNSKPIIYYEDGEKQEEDTFHKAFVTELINRPSCYECQFATNPAIGDFTIGDFWGVEEFEKEMDDGEGTSILLVNTKKAKGIFELLSGNMRYKKVTLQQALAKNHNKPIKKNPKRKKFFKKANSSGNTIKYLERYGKKTIIEKIERKLKI